MSLFPRMKPSVKTNNKIKLKSRSEEEEGDHNELVFGQQAEAGALRGPQTRFGLHKHTQRKISEIYAACKP